MIGPSKLITANDKPRSFAVIESSSYREAVRDMREAFANPETHLVIWNKAADLFLEDQRASVEKLCASNFAGERSSNLLHAFTPLLKVISPKKFDAVSQLKGHFNDIAKSAGLQSADLAALIEQSASFTQAIGNDLNANRMLHVFRHWKIQQTPGLHRDDNLNASQVLALRVLFGEKTEYYDYGDIQSIKEVLSKSGAIDYRFTLKEDAIRWQAKEGAIAFHSRRVVHSAPSVHNGGPADQMRLIEFHEVQSAKPFMACHQFM